MPAPNDLRRYVVTDSGELEPDQSGVTSMTFQSVLEECYKVLRQSASTHRTLDCPAAAKMCDFQADAVLEVMDDPECEHSPADKEG